MKFLIAGLGSIGRRHLHNLVRLGERDILLYRTYHSTLPDEELSSFPTETDLTKALENKPDAVIVSNPTALHMDVAIPAARAGCNIFLEKPISHNLERLAEFKEAINQGGGKVSVGFQFRFHPGLQHIKKLLTNGTIGRLLTAHVHWGEYLPGWHSWEDYRKSYSAKKALGGGVVLTLCHPLDYLHWMIGNIVSLIAIVDKISDLELEVEDFAEILMNYENGAAASLHLDYFQQPKKHTLEIIGTQGTIYWDNADGDVRVYNAEKRKWKSEPLDPTFERNTMFLLEMQHFIEVVKGTVEPACTLEDGIRVQQIIDAVYRSAKEKAQIDFKKLYGNTRNKFLGS